MTGPDTRTRPDSQTQMSDTDDRIQDQIQDQDTGPDQIIRSDTTGTDTVTDTDVDITIHSYLYPGKSQNICQKYTTGAVTGADTTTVNLENIN